MPLQNRVTPEGAIVATPHRGTLLGNRGGCFHRDDQTLKRRHFASSQWICCVLEFKNRHRRLMQPGLYTELFFLDEATALAAGHRPCFECRRADAEQFAHLWNAARSLPGRATAPEMDAVLHRQRIDDSYAKVISCGTLAGLPNGAFVRTQNGPALVWGGCLWPWSFDGYGSPVPAQGGIMAEVLTPPAIIAILALGFRPRLHPTLIASEDRAA
jgi:hypothetical protein